MKLVVGLGNPGWEQHDNRHNAGWWVMDAIAPGIAFERNMGAIYRKNFHAIYIMTDSVYMNEHGGLVKTFCDYYKIATEDVIVIHDELDFEPGVVRVKNGGGAGGHNGIKSIINHIGADFARVRIGIGRPEKDILNYVLSAPTDVEEKEKFKQASSVGADAVRLIVEFGVDHAMRKLNT